MSIHSLAIPLKKQLLNVFFKKLPSYSICHTPSDYPPKHYLSLVFLLKMDLFFGGRFMEQCGS